MKKFLTILLLLATMFPFAAKADQLTVCDGANTNGYVPVYGYYADAYLRAQMVYPASMLADMNGTTISGMKFYATQSSVSWGATFQVYMAEYPSTTISSFINPTTATTVYTGTLAIAGGEMVVTLDQQFNYAGGNLLIGFDETTTGGYSTSTWKGQNTTGAAVQGYSYTSVGSITPTVRGFLPKVTFDYYVPSLEVSLTDLGVRPNGAWMEPVTVEVGGGVYNVTGMDMDNDYFTFDGPEVPFTTPASFAVTTGDAAATGLVEGTLSFMFNDSKDLKQFTMTATAYNPTAGDVVETATVVANPVGYTNTPTGIYHNYNLPGEASDGADAVYKLTFASDVMLDANVGAAANGKVALYAEDFNGEGGPMATNNYEYNGPQVEPGAGDTFTEGFESGSIPTGWTTIDADGDGHNWTPASVLMQGYVIPFHSGADCITSESYSSTVGALTPDNYLVTPKVAITNGSTFSFWACAQDPSYASEHYGVAISTNGNTSASDFTTIAEWTMTAKEAAGAGAYMSKNGKGTREGSWYQKTVDLSEYAGQEVYIAIRHFNCSDWFYINVDDAELAIASKGEIARGGDSSFTEGFENGLNGWTNIDADGDGHVWMDVMDYGCYAVDYAHTGSHSAVSASYDLCGTAGYIAFNANNYLVSPQKYTIAEGSKLSFWYDDAEVMYSWPDYFEVCVSTAGNTSASDFTAVWNNGPAKSNGAKDGRGTRSYGTWRQVEVDLSAYAGQEVYIAFHHQQYDGYDLWIDDVELKVNEPAPGMFVPAGTYYLVAQATEPFTTSINATAAPAPEQAVIINPTDGMTNVEAPVAARWTLGNYTKEMQVLVGSQYPPQNVLIDWTSNLTNSATINDLLPNTTYFMQVNERNDSGVTMGEIIGFTTVLDAPAVLEVATSYLYPGDAAMLSWEMNRSFRGYNVYVDEMKVNEALITESEYAVEGLEYGPHTLNVTAVYDEGESAYSNDIEVEMTGFGHVAGAVFEQDSITPIAGAEVKFIGTDAFGFEQTFTFTSANDGTFTGDVYEGSYIPVVLMDGYQETALNEVNVAYESTVDGLTFIVREFFAAPGMVVAEELENNTVNIYWDWNPATLIEDFEHDGEMPEGWNQVGSYGWEITTNSPYEGTYCIKSSNAGIASSTGAIEMTVDVPYEAKMSFYVKPSSESNYDKFYFYIDGVEKFNTSGAGSWTKKEYTVEAGTHTYKWAYTKDSSVNSNDDCIYVDYVTLFEKVQPTPPVVGGTTYDFEDGFQGWTSLDADGDGYGWRQASTFLSGVAGHDGSADFVLSQSYDNTYGVLYPDNYLVSPSKLACQAGAQVKLWACGQDANYAAEHFGVAVSTGGATAAEFSTIAEWTIGSKGDTRDMAPSNRAAVRGTRDQSEWIEYTADLSAYAGQEVWVAIRHFNVSDMFYLDVDDVTLATGGAKMETADNRSFQSYNVYRKNVLTDEMTPIYSTTDTTYIDAEWSTLPAGVYQWGVSATYEGNRAQANASGVSRPAVPVTDASIDVTGRRPGQSPAYNGTMSNVFRGSTAYVDNTYGYAIPSGLCVMDIDNPLGATLLNANTSLYAGEIVDGVIYGYDSSGNFVTIDPATGAILSTVSTGATIREMAYDYTTNTMYGSSTSENTLYTIDLATGAYTAVGTMSNVSAVAGLVCDLNGQLYAMAFTTGDLYMVDKTNASMTLIGNTGRTPAYVQSAAIDYATGTCYWAYSDASNDDLYIVDLATAQASFVCNFVESCGLCFPHAGAPVPPAPVGDGESEITWSNTLEKGMVVAVDVTVVCNNGQSAEGATVKFTNMVEDLIIEGTADAAGVVSFPEFRSGYYTMEIAKAGYATVTDEVEIFEDKSYDITLNEMIAPAEGLFASATGWVMWDNIGGDIPTPGEGDEFSFSFDNDLEGWTNIDGDGDGHVFYHSNEAANHGTMAVTSHSGAGHVMGESYCNASYAALTPNDFFVTPQQYNIGASSMLSFWACAQDVNYAAEHFGVAISTSGNTSASDFTTIAEWTLTAKEGAKGPRATDGSREGAWYEFTCDLSEYAGQAAWIAIRHFNCSDQFLMCLDDVELTTGSKDRSALYSIVMLDGVIAGQATGNWFQLDTDNLVEGQEYEVSVASVYASGMSEWRTTTFTYYSCENFKPGVKNLAGEVEGNDVTLTWTLPGGGGSGDEFAFSFDNDLEGWTNIDADGDGHMWYHSNEAANHSTMAVTSHSGAGHVMGESYCNATWAALTPNDFFVTPQQYNIGSSSMLSFWACAQDENYAAEHFGVAISTTGNTSAADFTTIAEWTLTAKNGGPKGPRATDGSREGAWYEYTCDLSEYAGQAAWIAIRHFNCSDQFIMCLDDISMVNADGKKGNSNREMWDLLGTFNAAEGGHYGVVTDDEYIYTSNWGYSSALNNFYKYDMEGNVIEGFNISGCGTLRGMTFDGQYVYGVANSSTIYCVDLNNHTLVGTTTSAYGAMRGITYDPARDGFWVIGNWSGNLTLIDRTGAIVQAGPAPTSASDLAYFADPDGVEHVFCFNNGTNDVDDYNIATNTITTAVFNFNSIPGYDGGTSGGCHVATYAGKIAFFGDLQQSPNLIGIYELAEGETPIEGDFLGAMIFRDGELITPEPLMAQQMVDVNVPEGEHEYMARLAFGNAEFGVLDTMWYAMSCPVFATVNVEIECTPVNNLAADYEFDAEGNCTVELTWACADATAESFKVYRDGVFIYETTDMMYEDDRTNNPGSYTYGVVAVYEYCESEMVTVDITITDVEENDVVEGIYPNPTTGNLYIKAAAMQQITVANALGQVMMNETVSGDETMIDMSAFEAGVYMVRVATENGTTVKRISVVK